MFALIVTAALAALYGLTWHNRPAKESTNAGPETSDRQLPVKVELLLALGPVAR